MGQGQTLSALDAGCQYSDIGNNNGKILMNIFYRIITFFRRQSACPSQSTTPGDSVTSQSFPPLMIEGTHTYLTPEPDDAELSAMAILEMMSGTRNAKSEKTGGAPIGSSNAERDSTYYHALAERIREARRASALRTTRFVSFCEQELKKRELPVSGPGSLELLQVELYKRIDIVEREGGELKRRWQHCLAEVTVRLMGNAEKDELSEPQK